MSDAKYTKIQSEHSGDHQWLEESDRNSFTESPAKASSALTTLSLTEEFLSKPETTISMPLKQRLMSTVAQTTAATFGLILIYFVLSIGLTFYQRWLLSKFKYPLLVVLYHLILKLCISAIIRLIYRLITGKSRVNIDWKTSIEKVSPSGIASGLDIGFSNWGLALVTISLYTMTKSTTVIFILIFAIILGLEKKSWSLAMIVIMISGGLFMFTYKSTQFNPLGFIFLLFASLTSGVRWSFAQLVMQKSNLGLHNPVDMVYHMQPWMILAILPFTLGFEGTKIFEASKTLSDIDPNDMLVMWGEVTTGAVIAFIMELSEFLVLSFTSSLTLSIAGIFKEICQLVLAVEINGDQLSFLNIIGLVMCLGGICSHVIHKYTTLSSVNGINRNDGSSAMYVQKGQHAIKINYRSQKIPLLDGTAADESESDDSQNDNQNASDVIFDVLKRRDTRK